MKLISWERIPLSGYLKSDNPDMTGCLTSTTSSVILWLRRNSFSSCDPSYKILNAVIISLWESSLHWSFHSSLCSMYFRELFGFPRQLQQSKLPSLLFIFCLQWHISARLITYLHKMLSLILKMPHNCEYGSFSDIEKCIEVRSQLVTSSPMNNTTFIWYFSHSLAAQMSLWTKWTQSCW